ncbi:hypothetical protein BDY24DRAFT_432182 [Mrakia frigida]|uniref:glycosyl hydrolase family 79 C-terminal domain-containing protein n=1 Tax=Mrakia frigida TaxID=29902 RepID=UPI003FCC0178
MISLFLPLLALLAFVGNGVDAASLLPRYSTSAKVSIPLLPPLNTSKYIDGALGSFSFELAYWTEFWGTREEPNEFSRLLLQNLIDRTGKAPIIRIGGVSQDSSIYNPNATSIERTLSTAGAIYRTTYGPSFFDTFSSFPEGTKFVIPLNLGNDSYQIAEDAATAAWTQVDHDSIWAFELGNEIGHSKQSERILSNWTEDAYAKQWMNWTSAINRALGLPRPIWWTGDDITVVNSSTAIWDPVLPHEIVASGINNDSTVREFTVHAYQYNTCSPMSALSATASNLVNHKTISSFIDLMEKERLASESVGAGFVVGEFNAVACSGRPNLTDSFADALWLLDASLFYAASNITRAHVHLGATLASQSANQLNVVGTNQTAAFSTYNLWYPIDSPLRGPRRTNPSYLGYLALTEAIGGSGRSRIVELETPPNLSRDFFAGYAIWDDDLSLTSPSRLAFLNLRPFNVSSSFTNTSVSLDISSFLDVSECTSTVTLKRLTAPGGNELESQLSTWGGQSWSNGTADGAKILEVVSDGQIGLRGSEAVLVHLLGDAKW